MNYFIADGGVQRGPFTKEQLLTEGMRGQTLVWREGMPQWQRADSLPELADLVRALPPAPPVAYQTPPGFTPPPPPSASSAGGNKIAAGLCGILLGPLGIHKFILGYTGAGLTMLLITVLTCGFAAGIMHIIGIIEGIIYLTKSDEEFHQIYVVGRKAWF